MPAWLRLPIEIYGEAILSHYGPNQNIRSRIIQEFQIQVWPSHCGILQKVTNNSLPSGQQQVKQAGVQGYKVTSTRTISQNGKVLKTEALGSSYYVPTPRIIEVGPAEIG
ncbi:MAG TPA: G5 domain-containing protein [Desulfosporosinus sp.]|nr:G5 domain-containing protein [Desulfosporosinus sp.]